MFKIDLTERFPLLSRAPIIEAVLGVTARAQAPWEEAAISEQFKHLLTPSYPVVQSNRRISHQITLGVATQAEQRTSEEGWQGLRCQSEDALHIAQFNRDGFTFSRLNPYLDWDHFLSEGMRLCRIYRDVADPADMQRVGLRFINRIELPNDEEAKLSDFLENPPKPPREMDVPFHGFLHHNTLAIVGTPYLVNVIQTVQLEQAMERWFVILDIDVSTTEPIVNWSSLEKHLEEMRWLKNKAFFGSISSKTLEMIK
ncbi:MAG TPA: TIGR04255 family protein [Gallionellaceae bacterium]